MVGGNFAGEASQRAPDRPRAPTERPTKALELEDWLNRRIYHRFSWRLSGLLEATPVTPNMVSFASFWCIIGAGACYVGLDWPLSVAAGFFLHALWHVVDGADGDLARRTGRASPWGELIDGVCDYAGHFFLYWMLAFMLYGSIGHWAWPLVLASGLSRIVQSNHAETGRRTYLWRIYGIPWLKQVEARPDEAAPAPGPIGRLLAALGRAYVAAAEDPVTARVDALVADPAARRVCRRAFRNSIRVQTALGANYRTIALGLSMATGTPLWFFLLELFGLNLALIWSRRLQRRCNLVVEARLAPSEGRA
ncbi:MAG TPA: CDP-alcohol phosphatidyltransferase family protein [Allosphingosinicella sp.]|nr:CDP-alcohol phosphatidyltransferase family protein [Allosphingosinicella sp.]